MIQTQPLSTPQPASLGGEAIVIGAGLGGLAAAMRLGAKGYRVTVVDRLDMPGGRGSSISQGGHRFDLGPTIVTMPKVKNKVLSKIVQKSLSVRISLKLPSPTNTPLPAIISESPYLSSDKENNFIIG